MRICGTHSAFPLGGSGDRCPVVSVEMDLCPVRSGNLVLYGGGNGDTDSDHRGLSCGWILDTCDALHSYQPRERKLEILKDSHIGAFAVIMLTLYGLIFWEAFRRLRNAGRWSWREPEASCPEC